MSQQKRLTPPKKITKSYLYNAGLYYLNRFPASVEHFRFIMMRKIKKSCAHHKDQSLDECQTLLEQQIQEFCDIGLLNDTMMANALVESYMKRGLSNKALISKMRNKKLPMPLIQTALRHYLQNNSISAQDTEMKAALSFAKKKRIGPFDIQSETPPYSREDQQKMTQKQLGKFARAGFSYDIASRILALNYDDALHELEQFSTP